MKESFVIYTSFYDPIKGLSDKQLGRIFRALFDYQLGNGVQVEDDIKMAFLFFKNQMDIDGNKYMEICEKRKQAAAKGGAPKGNSNARKKTTESEKNNQNNQMVEKTTKTTYNDNENDNENENENEIKICRDESRHQSQKNYFEKFIEDFNMIRGTKFQAIEKVKKQFDGRLKEGFTPAQMLQALENAMKDPYHVENGYKYLTPEFFTRSDKIDKFLNFKLLSCCNGQNKAVVKPICDSVNFANRNDLTDDDRW